ncbi:sterile alpha motif domain-containing protein 9 [Lampris incognitus]|uniref:sterile alpha motif domain-containing protein 9 n=1 Tax=Lampris incognitus TaxID=2546036 RepID=UPI0024B60168|nr:sterile alpha motif domain-containing protein 9 [Lampris incognitus]
MSHSTRKPVKDWTIEEVHQWLMTEVKVHQTDADKIRDEEISGEYLVLFQKKDILDLDIKCGPAVKITFHLEKLKQGSKHKPQFPDYVEKWTKEQVCQWLLQHVNIYSKYAECFQKEDVSGDCLVCFEKKDLLDLGVKSGPAMKILDDLRKLNSKPEPVLQKSANQEGPQKALKCDPSPSQALTSRQPQPVARAEVIQPESKKVQLPMEKSPQEKSKKPKNSQTEPTQADEITALLTSATLLQNTLEQLGKNELKTFRFHLRHLSLNQRESIAQSKLEDRDSMDVVDLMIDHYGNEEALQVTLVVLEKIYRRDLVCHLTSKMGQLSLQRQSKEVQRREANQGDKLKNLLTCGGNSLDNYDRFILVVNKSSLQQLEYLQFLNKLKLFCVLDFDPNSAVPGGLCHSYRECRVANLHMPAQYQGQTDVVIKNLNLYKQTSWVFCNGRHDLDSDSQRELDYKNWFRTACKDVEQLISFICKPEVLLHGRTLIIFLLLSPVLNEKDPVFDTYKAFYKNREEESIISICESQSSYEQWRDLIQAKCECDITRQSVYELTLSEINGTIMALGPFNHSAGRLLPSPDSSVVILKRKDEDFITALDILCINQCENIYDENSTDFHDFKLKVEEEFFRGGKVKWWNFYFCDKPKGKPFIKRDKYDNLKKMIKSQPKDPKMVCVLLNLFHHPGCGGTTLAMHVMWDLRQDFRCAVLKDNTLSKTEVAIQVRKLMMLESDKPTPVLLLVDDSKETENAQYLVNCIRKAVVEDCSNRTGDDAPNYQVIILNCVRSHSPKEQYRQHSPTHCQYITMSLTQNEQNEFEEKLQELKKTHEKPENFYSFMIMKSNFDKRYIDGLVHNTLENLDMTTKNAQLFAFLALLNTYVAESEISISLSEDFLGMKMIRWREDNIMDRMKPYSNFLIIDTIEEYGGYKGIRILHHSIASACLDEFEKIYHLKVSEIAIDMLQCNLFFKIGVVRDTLMLSIQRMLIERQRKKDGEEREMFSPLIVKIHNQQGRQTIQEIFVKASSQFVTSASIPQALARYLYINEQDFQEALKWAEKAKKLKENPYTLDTIGQVYKSNLKSNMQSEKKTSCNPNDLDTNIKLAVYAIKAFQRAQELAHTEDEPEEEDGDEDSVDYPTKSSYHVYGYVGTLEIIFLVIEMLGRLPFFEEGDMRKMYLRSFLKQKIPITSVYIEQNEINNRYVEIIKEHERFLLSLKTEAKEIFEFFDCYFTYMKGNNSGEFDSKNHWTICSHFKKYINLFCTSTEETKMERASNPKLNLRMDIEGHRAFLEERHADTFAGIFQCLDRAAADMEKITQCYAFLLQNQQHSNPKQKTKDKINYILSNVILYMLKPKSKYVKTYKELTALLSGTLQEIGIHYSFPDPYYLALLFFWPDPTQEDTEIRTYVNAIRKSSRKRLSMLFQKRSTVAHFYLGKDSELGRLVPKPKLDECFAKISRNTLAQLWQSGDIFKEKEIISRLHRVNGIVELGEVFANYGNQKIPVRPAFLGGIRSGFSTEKVSFYIGFAINGPLAYDIQYVD